MFQQPNKRCQTILQGVDYTVGKACREKEETANKMSDRSDHDRYLKSDLNTTITKLISNVTFS